MSENIYWTDAIASEHPIVELEAVFLCGGAVCFWTGTDATRAQQELARAAGRARKGEAKTVEEVVEELKEVAPAPVPIQALKGQGDKFRTLADKLQKQIDDKLRDRPEHTAKMMGQAAQARHEGNRLVRTQTVLRGLGDLRDAGTVPLALEKVKSKKAVYDLMGEMTTVVQNGYHSYYVGTGVARLDTPEARAAWAMLVPKSEEEIQKELLTDKIRTLLGSKIPGYFPTQNPVIDRMFEHVVISSGDRVLEPNGGSGAILDRIRDVGANLDCLHTFEVNHTLREILTLKGYDLVGEDFMDVELEKYDEGYDKIMMNPPFERMQDAEHVMQAFGILVEGGTLVAIMSPSAFQNQAKKAVAFREWFREVGGVKFDIDSGAFKASGTMVSSVLVVMERT